MAPRALRGDGPGRGRRRWTRAGPGRAPVRRKTRSRTNRPTLAAPCPRVPPDFSGRRRAGNAVWVGRGALGAEEDDRGAGPHPEGRPAVRCTRAAERGTGPGEGGRSAEARGHPVSGHVADGTRRVGVPDGHGSVQPVPQHRPGQGGDRASVSPARAVRPVSTVTGRPAASEATPWLLRNLGWSNATMSGMASWSRCGPPTNPRHLDRSHRPTTPMRWSGCRPACAGSTSRRRTSRIASSRLSDSWRTGTALRRSPTRTGSSSATRHSRTRRWLECRFGRPRDKASVAARCSWTLQPRRAPIGVGLRRGRSAPPGLEGPRSLSRPPSPPASAAPRASA